jgi:hypothetical protein
VLRKPKTGRRANEAERQAARDLVDLYRRAQACPDGVLVLNPEDEYEIWTYIRADDPSHLLTELESFAENGTFAFIDSVGIHAMLMRLEFKSIRAGGKTYESAVAELAVKHHCSSSKIERALRLPSKRVTD